MIKYQKWIQKNIKSSLANKTIFITGGNSGIGFEATRIFVSLGAHIIWGCRNLEKANASKQKIVDEFALAKIDIVLLDLADTNSIRKCSEILSEKFSDIDVIYNNAGVFRIPRGKTKQNFELVVGTNLVGTYYLNSLLLEKYEKAQFIFTTSITAMFNKFKIKDPFFEKRRYGNFKAYGSSKFGINQIVTYWTNLYADSDRSLALVHPGVTYTPLIKKAYRCPFFCLLAQGFMKPVFHSTEKAALTAMLAVENNNKFAYYGPRGPFALSGYPKKRKLAKKYYKNNKKTIDFLKGLDL